MYALNCLGIFFLRAAKYKILEGCFQHDCPSVWKILTCSGFPKIHTGTATVYPKKYAHGFVVLCFVVVMQSFIMNSHKVFIHIHQGCFAGTGAIVRLPQCQWSKPDGYGKISQCITTTKHSKAKTVCIFLGINCISRMRITLLCSETINTNRLLCQAWELLCCVVKLQTKIKSCDILAPF